jgi:uncharacterized protein YqjF (DUF2071 family)
MNRRSTFLTAEWSNVLMLNYAVDSKLLQPFVPCGKVPFHQSFEEVNLRFYVKRAERRGGVFILELVRGGQ